MHNPMHSASRAFALFALVVAAAPSVHPQTTGSLDPYTSIRLHDRQYTNYFFRFSYILPDEMQTNFETAAAALVSNRAGAKAAVDQTLKQQQTAGVLLSATGRSVHEWGPPRKPADPSKIDNAPLGDLSRGTWYVAEPTMLVLTARPLSSSGVHSAKEAIEDVAARMRAQLLDPQVTSRGARFGSQDFFRVDCISWIVVPSRDIRDFFDLPHPGKPKKAKLYTTVLATERSGYAVLFTFAADSEKHLKSLVFSMDSLKFEAEGVTK